MAYKLCFAGSVPVITKNEIIDNSIIKIITPSEEKNTPVDMISKSIRIKRVCGLQMSQVGCHVHIMYQVVFTCGVIRMSKCPTFSLKPLESSMEKYRHKDEG